MAFGFDAVAPNELAGTTVFVDNRTFAHRGVGAASSLEHAVGGLDRLNRFGCERFGRLQLRAVGQLQVAIARTHVVHSENLGSDSYVYIDIGESEPLVVREDGTKHHQPDEPIAVRPQRGMIYRFDETDKPLARA